MDSGAEVYQWIAGGLASVLVLLCSFIFSRFSKVEEKLSTIAERTTHTETKLDGMESHLERITTTLDNIRNDQIRRSTNPRYRRED